MYSYGTFYSHTYLSVLIPGVHIHIFLSVLLIDGNKVRCYFVSKLKRREVKQLLLVSHKVIKCIIILYSSHALSYKVEKHNRFRIQEVLSFVRVFMELIRT